jgi:hypothetical protein
MVGPHNKALNKFNQYKLTLLTFKVNNVDGNMGLVKEDKAGNYIKVRAASVVSA